MGNKIQQEGVYREFLKSEEEGHKSEVAFNFEKKTADGIITMIVSDKTTQTKSLVNKLVLAVKYDAVININEDCPNKSLLGLRVLDMNVASCHKYDKNNTKTRFVIPYEDVAMIKDEIRSLIYKAYAEETKQAA